jgi:hypothetical protein
MLAAVGISESELLSERYNPEHFGDGEASFGLSGSIILRLVRERGEDFVDIAPRSAPGESFRWDDLCVALGWCKVEDVVGRTRPIPTDEVLAEVVERASDLDEALAVGRLPSTRKAVKEAGEERERAFLEKLQRLADAHDRGSN